MSLYKSEDSNAAKAAVEKTIAADTSGATVVFIDATEAGLAANRERGLVSPGWWSYQTYTDHAGNTRHKAECIAALSVAAGTSGDDADDTLVADVASSVSITAQPAAATRQSFGRTASTGVGLAPAASRRANQPWRQSTSGATSASSSSQFQVALVGRG